MAKQYQEGSLERIGTNTVTTLLDSSFRRAAQTDYELVQYSYSIVRRELKIN
jgi:hypothetical protein